MIPNNSTFVLFVLLRLLVAIIIIIIDAILVPT